MERLKKNKEDILSEMKIPENKISHSSTFDTFTSDRVNIFFYQTETKI